MGAVVAIDDFFGRRVYTIDDSSGACIECNVSVKIVRPEANNSNTYSLEPPKMNFEVEGSEDVDVGHIVDVKGLLSTFRGEMTIQIQKINTIRATQEEVVLWERRIVFDRDVLRRPWTLTQRQIDKCRRTAEEDADKQKRREEKAKRREQHGDTSERHGKRPAIELDGYGRPKHARRQPDTRDPPPVELDGYGRPKRPKGSRSTGLRSAAQRREEAKGDGASVRGSSRIVLDESMRGKYSALGL